MAAYWKLAVVVMAAYALLLGVYVAMCRGDVSTLVCVGQTRINEAPYDAITIPVDAYGYDGQFDFAFLPLTLWLGFIQCRKTWPTVLWVEPLVMVVLPVLRLARHLTTG